MLAQRLLTLLALVAASAQAARIQVRTDTPDSKNRVRKHATDPNASTQQWFDLGEDRTVKGGTLVYLSLVPPPDPNSIIAGRYQIETNCTISGRLEDGVEEIAFVITDTRNYLHPCFGHHGITILCQDPQPVCKHVAGLNLDVRV